MAMTISTTRMGRSMGCFTTSRHTVTVPRTLECSTGAWCALRRITQVMRAAIPEQAAVNQRIQVIGNCPSSTPASAGPTR